MLAGRVDGGRCWVIVAGDVAGLGAKEIGAPADCAAGTIIIDTIIAVALFIDDVVEHTSGKRRRVPAAS